MIIKLKKIALISIMLLSLQLYAQKSGIHFQKKTSWIEILKKAQAENKMIFVDVYTEWCGPCKVLNRDVFPNEAVGAFYNKNFISVKINPEKESVPEVLKTFGITCYPSLYYLSNTGEVKHKVVNSMPIEKFIASGKIAINDNENLTALMALYKKGNKNPKFLKKYLTELKNADMHDEKVSQAYFKNVQKKDILKGELSIFIYKNVRSVDNNAFKIIVENIEEFNHVYSKYATANIISNCIKNEINKVNPKTTVQQFESIKTTLNNIKYVDTEKNILELQIKFAKSKDNLPKYFSLNNKYLNTYALNNWIDLWKFSRDVFATPTMHKDGFQMALVFAKKALTNMSNYSTLTNFARGLEIEEVKKNKTEIISLIQRAIKYEQDHKTGRDCSSEKEWLEKIKNT